MVPLQNLQDPALVEMQARGAHSGSRQQEIRHVCYLHMLSHSECDFWVVGVEHVATMYTLIGGESAQSANSITNAPGLGGTWQSRSIYLMRALNAPPDFNVPLSSSSS